ncbi:PREDICTED: killer cell immunoglobulin-like receptor 2DL5A-like [Elephantulus edwardii]|uniref:killer cell immunoglobulin-like receptor 2DL5A-like n=1 Tax=Elephantulus edwardii TaxID=28737 RepID=UPI0003F06FF0|nr:PREDICTED: killer cell immunoglobulin-like receptor 2DL5A-like [Elephantulus edwardii]
MASRVLRRATYGTLRALMTFFSSQVGVSIGELPDELAESLPVFECSGIVKYEKCLASLAEKKSCRENFINTSPSPTNSSPLPTSTSPSPTSKFSSPAEPNSQAGNSRLLSILIRLSAVTIILVLLICFLICHCCRAKKDATMLSREPEVDTAVSGKVPEEDPQEVTYTELGHWTPKRKNITPTPQRSEAPSTNTHLYMQVAVH